MKPLIVLFFLILTPNLLAIEVPPKVPHAVKALQPGVKVTLLAEHPDLVTPTGIDVDDEGQLWVVSSHTHFRPEGYEGPEKDEILVFDADGSNRRVFATSTVATMDLELGKDGWVYLAERDRIFRIRDSNGDGKADQEENLATLETEADYPHNGLAGLAWHPSGDLVFALGENFWTPWTLTDVGGSNVMGTGEGGIFRMTADGKNLRRIAQGFWNPFGICVREDGEIFAAENDPGARPPCRLIHVVEGGDYGYQRRYGNAPFHPFVAWNGELRGTLPMIHATGEAPCAILPLGGGVMVPSWSDNRIDFFPLHPKGASYTSERIELVRGSTHFRPTCFAEGEDGVFYFTDWVFTAYTLHQRGRLWKLKIDCKAEWLKPETPAAPTSGRQLANALRNGAPDRSLDDVLSFARSQDPFLARAALMELARRPELQDLKWFSQLGEADRINAVLAAKLSNVDRQAWVKTALADPSDEVRFETLRWIADEDLTAFRPDIDQLFLKDSLDYRSFEALLAAANTLDGNPRAGVADSKMLMARIQDQNVAAQVRAFALRLFPAKDKQLKLSLLNELIALGHDELTFEAIRSLNAKNSPEARGILAKLAQDEKLPIRSRAEAILGLAADPGSHREVLAGLAQSKHLAIRDEARRASPANAMNLSGIPPFTDTAAWQSRIDSAPGNADREAGRRLFFHPRLTRCHTCHRHSGRGAVVGPDLSAVADRSDPTWLLQSILEPSREVAPQYYSWQLSLTDGATFTGIALRQGGNSGKVYYRDITGAEQSFVKTDIHHRQELQTSLMPGGLMLALTPAELRDLIAFLSE
tara:strand:- start:7669 stop:10110 length:2442 start_codon:yes stop_codon:yes gene_type:complete